MVVLEATGEAAVATFPALVVASTIAAPHPTSLPPVDSEEKEPNKCLGVFGLSLYTTERELEKEFGSCGFAFVYYENIKDATMTRAEINSLDLDERKIRVNYSITNRPHTLTPGMYLGKPTDARGGKLDNHYWVQLDAEGYLRRWRKSLDKEPSTKPGRPESDPGQAQALGTEQQDSACHGAAPGTVFQAPGPSQSF